MSPKGGHGEKIGKDQFIYGTRPVLECLRAGRRRLGHIYLLVGRKDFRFSEIKEMASEAGVPVVLKSREELTHLSASPDHQGVVAAVGPLPVYSLEELPDEVSADGKMATPASVVLVLDSIVDPRNFGALCRSALALGCRGVVFTKDRSAGLSPAALKASAGSMERIPLFRVTNLPRALEKLKEKNYWTIGLAEEGEHLIDDVWCDGPIALVVGSEDKGLRRLVRKQCDQVMRLKTLDDFSTLNVSVAGAIALYEVNSKRDLMRIGSDTHKLS